MVLTKAGVFTLDRSNPKFYILCGRIHVKIAFGLIVLFFMTMEVAEWMLYITVDEIGENTTWFDSLISKVRKLVMFTFTGELLFDKLMNNCAELFQFIMVISMTFAFIEESAKLMIPFIIFMFLTISSLSIWIFKAISWLINPYSEFVEDVFGFDKDTPFMAREQRIALFLGIIMTVVMFLSYWLHIALVCYQYFESRENEKRQKMAHVAANQPPLVLPNQHPTQPTSFPNQNFSLSDEEDDEDKVFEKKPNGPDMV